MRIFGELSQLIFPVRCFGCNRLGLSICSQCRSDWQPQYFLSHFANLRVHSAVLYSPTASKIILAAKENGLKEADKLIIEAIQGVLAQANFANRTIELIPIPSSPSARRRRGRSFMVDITAQIAQRSGFRLTDVLELTRRVSDQSGLHAKARAANMEGAFALKPHAYPRGDLVLIDDVVTTGATLREAARALTSQGLNVLASVTACLAQPLR
ncbi:unannotated protein [freshwater metagenome]|uniref:Unannotated protein n=1 Tax=freshwater metagenome TaxID=449393 RepID=A0A6J6YAB6_9ZZZZ|nr:hypothetical protein [Actinomycetota bacterium]MSW62786.1 hypothetical protein [Actinomycetota bacterium]MSX89874.1 hypothetical protein [Actinomycetota bacterium]MSZ63470.1 hypothetical protein [Actinomycetota bacterium]